MSTQWEFLKDTDVHLIEPPDLSFYRNECTMDWQFSILNLTDS